jgi:hypothetical protein
VGGFVMLHPKPNVSEGAAEPSQQLPTSKAKSSSRHVVNISVREIVDAVRVAPPLQQTSAANPYVGVQVEWVGYLKSAEQTVDSTNRAQVNLNVSRDKVIDYSIWFSADLSALPELRLLHQDSKLRVKGQIVSVNVPGISVSLDASEVVILERAKK